MHDHIEPATLVKAPLRNRLRLELHAPVPDVWALVGNIALLPDYSAELERVETRTDENGRCTEYTCHFKPSQPGEEALVTRDIIRWYQPGRGWASSGAADDAFGLSNDLHLVTLEPSTDGTLLTWDSYYDAQDPAAIQAHLHEAFTDIGQNLLKRFGGQLIHCYVIE